MIIFVMESCCYQTNRNRFWCQAISLRIYVYLSAAVLQNLFQAEAIVRFFEPKELVLIATEASKDKSVDDENDKTKRVDYLEEKLGDKTKVEVIIIPEGKSEAELWKIFDQLVNSVKDDENILFDITHGFRSLPLLALTMITYIRLVKPGATIERVIYGAHEGSNSQIIDLTMFVDLMSWIDAVSTFKSSGNLSKVSQLLETRQNEIWRRSNHINRSDDSPRLLKTVAKSMRDVSQGLEFNRLKQVQKDSIKSVELLKQSKSEINKWVQPFSPLIDSVVAELEPLSVKFQNTKDFHNLQSQHRQILWYNDKKQFTHVFLLAREWLVSVGCRLMILDDQKPEGKREREKKRCSLEINTHI